MKPTAPLKIDVETEFIAEQSDETEQRYLFHYHVTMVNKSEETLVLQRRHWVITDGNGEQTEVEGAGVVGETPTLAPGGSYRYSSSIALTTPMGSMTGNYILSHERELIKNPIPRFRLCVPGTLH